MAGRRKPVEQGASGLGLGHLGRDPEAAAALSEASRVRPRGDPARSRRRGKDGEREVVRLWHREGWTEAFRTPGSGSWRPYGAGDQSPFPLDVASGWPGGYPGERSPWAGPWMVEVKYDERVRLPGFVRATLRKADQQAVRYRDTTGGRVVHPCAFMRRNREPWRVFYPIELLHLSYGGTPKGCCAYVETSLTDFFDHVSRSVLEVRRWEQ